MKLFLDIGAAVVLAMTVAMLASWFVALPPLEDTLGTVMRSYNPLAIPAVFFCFYILWHMLKTRSWGWFFTSFVLAPFTFLAYYWRSVRPHLAVRGAQPIIQADR